LQGAIVIDHKEQTLEVRVSPSEKQGSVVDTKSLSGGERSYSTVSFIMALWDAVDPPFYFLDEFDVFMVRTAETTIQLVIVSSQSLLGCDAV
jgi:chromosome segregation ATPase